MKRLGVFSNLVTQAKFIRKKETLLSHKSLRLYFSFPGYNMIQTRIQANQDPNTNGGYENRGFEPECGSCGVTGEGHPEVSDGLDGRQ
jgi:hypothetical protein